MYMYKCCGIHVYSEEGYRQAYMAIRQCAYICTEEASMSRARSNDDAGLPSPAATPVMLKMSAVAGKQVRVPRSTADVTNARGHETRRARDVDESVIAASVRCRRSRAEE